MAAPWKLTNIRQGRADVIDRATGWPLGRVVRCGCNFPDCHKWVGTIDHRRLIEATTRRDAAYQVAHANPAIDYNERTTQ